MTIRSIPAAKSSTVKSVSTQKTVLVGTDRLLSVENITKVPTGNTFMEYVVTPSSFPRLARMASAFQRIRWKRLVFHVQPHVTTSSSGGYVASFVADPTDDVPSGAEGLNILTSQACSRTANIYEPSKLVVPARDLKGLMYTSQAGAPRLFSPGKFVLMADGAATQEGSLVVTCEWEVSLEVPGLEEQSEERPGLLFTHDSRLGDGTGADTAGYVSRASDQKMDASLFTNVEECCPNKEDVYHFKIPYAVSAGTTAGSETETGYIFWNLHYLRAVYQKDMWVLIPSEYVGSQDINHKLDNHVSFLPKGAECIPHDTNGDAGLQENFREVPLCHSVSGARVFSRPLPKTASQRFITFQKY